MTPQEEEAIAGLAMKVGQQVAELVANALKANGWKAAEAAGQAAADKVTTLDDAEAAAARRP